MITTNVGGLSEIILHNKVGFVVEPNHKQIANAIYNFFENNLENEFSENIKTEKVRFSWTKFLEVLDEF
jgi:glycosyltransferase involved in cell wall biosynthesis